MWIRTIWNLKKRNNVQNKAPWRFCPLLWCYQRYPLVFLIFEDRKQAQVVKWLVQGPPGVSVGTGTPVSPLLSTVSSDLRITSYVLDCQNLWHGFHVALSLCKCLLPCFSSGICLPFSRKVYYTPIFYDLFIWKPERVHIHQLVHFPNDYKSQGWARTQKLYPGLPHGEWGSKYLSHHPPASQTH